MDQEDRNVWEAYTKDIRPLNKSTIIIPESKIEESDLSPMETMTEKLDFNIKLHNTQNPDRIDLHGHTLENAYKATQNFITRSYNRGMRFVTVITGHGSGKTSISKEFPHWIKNGPCHLFVIDVYPIRQSEEIPGAYTVHIKPNQRCR